jgi:DNA-binding CsgD family transcriptional regulator
MSGNEDSKEAGRPKLELDEEQIGRLASIHCSVDEIALIMGCGRDTIYRNYMHIVEEGRAKGKMGLRRRQWEVANEGNPTMLVWLGKNWLDQTDAKQVNDEDNKPLPWDDEF